MNWEDKILIKLRRQYTESEAVQAFAKKLKECQIENGKLKSELEEANHIANKSRKEIREELKEEYRKEPLYLNAVKTKNAKIKKLEALVERLKKSNNQLINRINANR